MPFVLEIDVISTPLNAGLPLPASETAKQAGLAEEENTSQEADERQDRSGP